MELTDEQREELESVSRHGEPGYVRIKALVLLNLAEGQRLSHLARIFRVARQSIYDWRARYADRGIESLWVQPGRGRKPQVDLEDLERHVRQSPRHFGVPRTRWTLAALAQVVPSLKGMTPAGVHQALKRAGFSYKRGQPWLHSPDPEYDQKKGLWSKR